MKRLLNAFALPAIPHPAFGHGIAGHFGIGKQTAFGTAVAASDYAEIMSENLTTTIDRFPTRNVHAAYHEPDNYAGAQRNGGDVVLAANAVSMGFFLKGAMNTVSKSVVASGSLWTSRFITNKENFDADCPFNPFTYEIFRDVGSSHRYADAIINRLTLAIAPNQDLRLTASLLARTASIIAKTTPTFPGSPADPFGFDTASISIGGAGTSRLEALTISVNNNLEGILALNGSKDIARFRRRGPQEVRISGVLDFIDNAEFDDFIAQTERALTFSVTKANSFKFVAVAPRFVYTAFPLGIGGRDRLTVSFEGEARYLTSSATAIDLQLTTTRSNY